jgi:hypothetical protein
MGEYNRTAHLRSEICAGVQSCTRTTLFRKQTNWIRPTPRDSGLRQKRQCGVLSSYEESQRNIKLSGAPAALIFSGRPNQEIG